MKFEAIFMKNYRGNDISAKTGVNFVMPAKQRKNRNKIIAFT